MASPGLLKELKMEGQLFTYAAFAARDDLVMVGQTTLETRTGSNR